MSMALSWFGFWTSSIRRCHFMG